MSLCYLKYWSIILLYKNVAKNIIWIARFIDILMMIDYIFLSETEVIFAFFGGPRRENSANRKFIMEINVDQNIISDNFYQYFIFYISTSFSGNGEQVSN